MSISGISSMSKALSDFEGIGSALRETDGLLCDIAEAFSSVSRTYEPMFTEDEVKHRPAVW